MNTNRFSDDSGNSFHSNDYAKIATDKKDSIISPQTFNQRLYVERNRKVVRKYRDSMIANHHHHEPLQQKTINDITSERPRSPAITPPNKNRVPQNQHRTSALIVDVTSSPMRQRFVEPPSRKFNPYQ